MQLNEIQFIFNRALALTFNRTKWLFTSLILALAGILIVFCRGLSEQAGPWLATSLTFIPLFLFSGSLLSFGIILIRGYHDEIKKKDVDYYKILKSSWQALLGAAYFTVPVVLIYLGLWLLLGIFLFLKTLPSIGELFSVILVFIPFLLHLATLLFCLLVVATLFFITPIVALKGLNASIVSQISARAMHKDSFSNFLLFFIGILPFLISFGFLFAAASMTGSICFSCDSLLKTMLQWFFLMIPFAALLAPSVIFFFNFAAEAHVLQKVKS